MAIEIPTSVPKQIVAGDYVQWKIAEDPDRPISDGWVLTYAIVKTGKSHEIICTDSGDNFHLATITVADSQGLPAGRYRYQAYVTLADDRRFVAEGSIEIKENFADLDGGHDGRTFWRTVMENCEAVIQDRATKDQSSYTVNGRQLSRTPVGDLLLLYNTAKANVASEEKAEKIKNGESVGGMILTRFQ